MLLGTILCKFGQICATGNTFVRLIVGRTSILNFPAKIWTGMCRALLCENDSSHSQSQYGKRLLLAFKGHPIRSLPQGWLLVPQWSEPTPWTRPQMPPGPKTPVPIQLLKKDMKSEIFLAMLHSNAARGFAFCILVDMLSEDVWNKML